MKKKFAALFAVAALFALIITPATASATVFKFAGQSPPNHPATTYMDDISVVVLTTPILLPIINELGVNPVHYASIVGVNTALGCITPPAAPVLYLSGRVGGAPISEIMKPALTFMVVAWIPILLITTYIPKLVLFLPHVILDVPW